MSLKYSSCNTPIKTMSIGYDHFQNAYEFCQARILCDVTLTCDDGVEILAHRLILALASPVLLTMFDGGFKESKQINIPMKNIDSLILKSIITCAYTLHMNIDEHNIEKLLKASEYFQFNHAQDLCYDYVKENINADNCINFLRFAEPTSQNGLYNYSYLYCVDNFKTILKSESQTKILYELNYEDIFKIISNDHLMVESEEQLFDFIIKWIEYDTEERSRYLSNLLNYLRLPLISKKLLLSICDEPLVKNQHDCSIDIMKNYMSVDVDENITKATIRTPHLYEPNIIFAINGKSDGDDSSVMYLDLRREDDLNWRSCDYSFFCPPRRGATMAIAENGIVLAIGGYNTLEKLDNCVYELDLSSTSKMWMPTTPLNKTRSPAVATQGKYIYVVGGQDLSGRVLNSIEYYDTYSKVWTEIKKPMPTPRWGCCAIVHGDCLYVVGGHDGKNSLSSVECYNLQECRWTQCNPMPIATIVTGIAIRGNDLHIISAGSTNCVYKMNLNDSNWYMLPNMIDEKEFTKVVTTGGNNLFVVGKEVWRPYSESLEIYCERYIAEKNMASDRVVK